uniref:Uncharacterized protein n=1 Tax=Trichuris muris TaxID=70415 RepID=A0A5S6R4M3_TRIMR
MRRYNATIRLLEGNACVDVASAGAETSKTSCFFIPRLRWKNEGAVRARESSKAISGVQPSAITLRRAE